MRPIKLSMTAFGPFSDQQSIDFTALGECPLFLINGPTGAGKTTILDAICFALYGQTTAQSMGSNEREAKQMRCDFSSSKQLTEIIFEFEFKQQRYLIHRIPEQMRAKAKGEGLTLQSPEATIHRLLAGDEKELHVSKKVTEANQFIEQLLGLKVDQFRQVVILPQGKFRTLLLADSLQREKIFSQIFQTSIYQKIAEQLRQQASGLRDSIRQLDDNQHGMLQSIHLENYEQLLNEIEHLKPEVKASKKQLNEVQEQLNILSHEYSQAQQIVDQFKQWELQKNNFEQLKNQQKDIDEKRELLKNNDQAQSLLPAYRQYQKIIESVKAQDEQQKATADRLKQVSQQYDEITLKQPSDKDLAQLQDDIQKASKLAEYQQRSSALAPLKKQRDVQKKQCDDAKKTLLFHNGELKQLTDEHKEKSAQLNKLQQQYTDQSDLALALERDKQELKQKLALEDLSQRQQAEMLALEQQAKKGEQIRRQHDEANKHSKQLDYDWHQGQAAILASELGEGQACPVCGSMEHPQLAQSDIAVPSQQQRELAQKKLADLAEQLTQARGDYTRINTIIKELGEQIAVIDATLSTATRSLSVADLQQSCRQKKAELDQYKKDQAELEKLMKALKELDKSIDKQRHLVEKSQSKQHEDDLQYKQTVTRLQAELKELPEAYQKSDQLQQAITALDNQIAKQKNNHQQVKIDLQQASDQRQQYQGQLQSEQATLKKLKSEQDQLQQAWEQSLEASQFVDVSQFQQSLLSDTDKKDQLSDIADFEKKYFTLKGVVEAQEKQLKTIKKPEISVLQEKLKQQQDKKDAQQKIWQDLDKKSSHFNDVLMAMNEIQAEQVNLKAEYKTVGTLAEVANGKFGDKISLNRFVLSVLLDEVLVQASLRLSKMTQGRYQLLRKEERAKGNKASGLELEIADSHTGKPRPVSTLSGGESFKASLALALGLSDVVQSRAGGIQLDTLFIDEGFGSLDAESLNSAIQTMIELRNTGRIVGIISHVQALKEQIATRIDVQVALSGSRIQVVA